MTSLSLRPLFRDEVARLSAQIRDLMQRIAPGVPSESSRSAFETLNRRWLALKGAAIVVEAAWLERVAETVGLRLHKAIDAPSGLSEAEILAMDEALRLATDAAAAGDDNWEQVHADAREKSRALLALLGTPRKQRSTAPPDPASVQRAVAVELPGTVVPEAAEAAADARAARMHELLKKEVAEQTSVMQRLLLDMDADPEQTQLIDPLLRAAHSLKGAARAAQVDPAVRLAHEFETSLASLQRGETAASPARTDLYLRVVDQLLSLASRAELLGKNELDEATEQLIQTLVDDDVAATQEAEMHPPAVATTAAAAPRRLAASPVATDQGPNSNLRVSAQAINALLGMTAQQLVEVERMRGLAGEVRSLRNDGKLLHEELEQLYRHLDASGMPDDVSFRMGTLRHRLKQNRQKLNEHGEHLQGIIGQQELLVQRLYRTASEVRLRPLRDGLVVFPRMVRDLARQLGKNVRLVVSGDELTLDRDILERIDAPLTHLLRNALDHGLEPPSERVAAGKPAQGTLRLDASHHCGMLLIELSDDGRGIDPQRIRERLHARLIAEGKAIDGIDAMPDADLLEQLFVSGFSLAEKVTELSGRGVGLDVVRTNLQDIDGSVRVTSTLGHGTTFHLLVPTSRVIVRTVVVDVCGERYGFPLARVGRLMRIPSDALEAGSQTQYTYVDGINLRLFGLAGLLELGDNPDAEAELNAVVIDLQGQACAFVVQGVHGEFDLSVRPIDPRLGRVTDVSAAAVMPDGEPVVLLDVDDLLRSAQRQQARTRLHRTVRPERSAPRRILVTDDSISVRELERQLLLGAGYEVDVAVDGAEAWRKVREGDYDLLVTDVDMPRMNGIELTRSIKQDPVLRSLPVMIVSYRNQPEDRARGLDARADCYVTKSDFQDERFLSLVDGLVGEGRTANGVERARA